VTIFVSTYTHRFNGDHDPSHDVVEQGQGHRMEGVARPEKAHDPYRLADAHSGRNPLAVDHRPFYLGEEEGRLFDQVVAVDHTPLVLARTVLAAAHDHLVPVAAHDRLESGLGLSGPDLTLVHLDPDFSRV
jgi:hypothetical protein